MNRLPENVYENFPSLARYFSLSCQSPCNKQEPRFVFLRFMNTGRHISSSDNKLTIQIYKKDGSLFILISYP